MYRVVHPIISHFAFSRPLRTTLLRACSWPHVFLLLAAADLLAPLISSRLAPLAFPFASARFASLSFLAAAAHITSRGARLLSSPLSSLQLEVVHPSISYSLICHASQPIGGVSRLPASFVRSFAHLFTLLSLSLSRSLSRFAALRSALLRTRSSASAHLASLLFSASPAASSHLVPGLSSLPSTHLFIRYIAHHVLNQMVMV